MKHMTEQEKTSLEPSLKEPSPRNAFFTDVWIYRPHGIIFVEPILEKLNKIITLEGKRTLHLFSGKSKYGVTCDINPFNKPDHIIDCTQKLPFGNEEFDVVLAEPPYYSGHDYGVKPYSFIKESVRVLKIGGFLCILHTLHYQIPKGMKRTALIGISTGPNLKARWLNIFQKIENLEILSVNSEKSMRRMV